MVTALCSWRTVLAVAVPWLGGLLVSATLAASRPAPDENNVWFEYNASDTAFVFVHGIFSDSRDAWFHQADGEAAAGTYWPELVLADDTFNRPAVFLGGFYSEFDSGDYGIRDAANELYRSLAITIPPGDAPVLAKPNILFIAHSTGGIVVRHMLVRQVEKFRDKTVGLVLMASPSTGSRDANRLAWLADIAKQRMGSQLQWDHPFLEELHLDFKNLVYQQSIPRLVGVEAIENHFVVKWMRLFDKEVLVEASSGGQYFGEPQRMPNTDHFSIVKPPDANHPSHKLLRLFYLNSFLPAVGSGERAPQGEASYRFLTPHAALVQRGRVEVKRQGDIVAVLPFDVAREDQLGVYTASALIDSRRILERSFHLDEPERETVTRFDDDVVVNGRVVNGNGRPISNVLVSIDGRTTRTTSDGRYVIDGLELKRDYSLNAYAPNGTFSEEQPWTGTVYNGEWVTRVQYNIDLVEADRQ